jgi:hypothetical protein
MASNRHTYDFQLDGLDPVDYIMARIRLIDRKTSALGQGPQIEGEEPAPNNYGAVPYRNRNGKPSPLANARSLTYADEEFSIAEAGRRKPLSNELRASLAAKAKSEDKEGIDSGRFSGKPTDLAWAAKPTNTPKISNLLFGTAKRCGRIGTT